MKKKKGKTKRRRGKLLFLLIPPPFINHFLFGGIFVLLFKCVHRHTNRREREPLERERFNI
jgi:hypothetical protein